MIEEVVVLQEQLTTAKSGIEERDQRMKEMEEEVSNVSNLRAKVDLLEKEKRSLENKIVDLRVQVASTEITNNDSGRLLLSV